MIKLFRNVRRRLLDEGHLSRYLAYATGEIVLVVIGILIALQINNLSDARKDRARELGYLANIRTDVMANIAEMDHYLAIRTEGMEAENRILLHFNGKAIDDLAAFNADQISIYDWRRFYLIDNTYQELVNSGNFALLSNDRIKHAMLDIESQYRKLKAEEDHFRFDSETLLYKPLYASMDLEPMIDDFAFRASKGQAGRQGGLSRQAFEALLGNRELKNGFSMTILEFDTMNGQMREMKRMSQALVAEIDADMAR